MALWLVVNEGEGERVSEQAVKVEKLIPGGRHGLHRQ